MKWLIHPNLPKVIVTGGSRIDHIKSSNKEETPSRVAYLTKLMFQYILSVFSLDV